MGCRPDRGNPRIHLRLDPRVLYGLEIVVRHGLTVHQVIYAIVEGHLENVGGVASRTSHLGIREESGNRSGQSSLTPLSLRRLLQSLSRISRAQAWYTETENSRTESSIAPRVFRVGLVRNSFLT